MTGGVECVREDETHAGRGPQDEAARGRGVSHLRADDRLKGMLTGRDIVVMRLAQGQDPASTSAEQLTQGKPDTFGADDALPEWVRTMAQHQVKRLSVIDGHRLVGAVSEADPAERASPKQVVAVVRA
jgi:CBS domain-containing protein